MLFATEKLRKKAEDSRVAPELWKHTRVVQDSFSTPSTATRQVVSCWTSVPPASMSLRRQLHRLSKLSRPRSRRQPGLARSWPPSCRISCSGRPSSPKRSELRAPPSSRLSRMTPPRCRPSCRRSTTLSLRPIPTQTVCCPVMSSRFTSRRWTPMGSAEG